MASVHFKSRAFHGYRSISILRVPFDRTSVTKFQQVTSRSSHLLADIRTDSSYGAISKRKFGTSNYSGDLSSLYKIEANNAARQGTTQLTVIGPDIDGILASMTVALATQDCSLVELHAAKSVDTSSYHYSPEDQIHDIFHVVNRHTGQPFSDDELEPLAISLLEALKTPMVTLRSGPSPIIGKSVEGAGDVEHAASGAPKYKISIVPSTAKGPTNT